jgi:MYXO-CTERM domain-containing protein
LTATFDAAGLDGPTTAAASVKAVDSGAEERTLDIPIDVLNVPPVFLSDPAEDPGLELYRGTPWSYYIVVEDPANADGVVRDPTIIDVVEKPAGMIYFGDMHLEWTPRIDGSDTGNHLLRIEADDRESDEPGIQQVTLEVLENAPPSAPSIVRPDATTVGETRPDLVVENAEDIDGDMLSYQFEVASTGDFASVIARGNTFEGTEGQTSWTVTTTLADGTRYYWRVWCNDGRTDGPASSSWFDVDTSLVPPDASTDAPTDVATDTGIPPTWGSDEGGCGCRTVPSEGSDSAWAAALIALAMLGLALRPRRV